MSKIIQFPNSKEIVSRGTGEFYINWLQVALIERATNANGSVIHFISGHTITIQSDFEKSMEKMNDYISKYRD